MLSHFFLVLLFSRIKILETVFFATNSRDILSWFEFEWSWRNEFSLLKRDIKFIKFC
jgi:hypothetical protein